MERNRNWHQQSLSRSKASKGQSTVEFAVVLTGFLSVVVALGAVGHLLGGGSLIAHALDTTLHCLVVNQLGALSYAFLV